MTNKFSLLFMISLLTLTGYSQQKKLDSLHIVLKTVKEDTSKVNILNAISDEETNLGEYPQARKDADEALTLGDKLKFKRGAAESYDLIGIIYYYLGDYFKALEYHQKALVINKKLDNGTGSAANLNGMGMAYWRLSDYSNAFECFQKSMFINEQTGNKAGLASNLQGIANVYHYLGDDTKAMEYCQKALAINKRLNNKIGIASNLRAIGNLYQGSGDFSKAIEYAEKALKIDEGLGNKDAIARNLGNIGNFYGNLSDYPKALEYLQKGLKIEEEIGNKNIIAWSNIIIGDIYCKQGKMDEALKFESKALSTALEIGAKQFIRDAYGEIAIIDSSRNDFKGAFKNRTLSVDYNDSIFNIEKNKKITELQMQDEYDKKAVLQKAEQDKKDTVQRLIRNVLTGGLSVVLIFSFVFFRQRNKISKEKKRSDDLLLNILPSEVAEELKNTGGAKAKSFDEVTVMFTDFKGFTQISEKMSPEELVAEIDYCFKSFDRIIEKHGIEKIKTIGDSYMCVGGLPVKNVTHPDDVVKAAIEIRDFILNHKKEREAKGEIPFEVRIGIHTGPVVAGIVGIKKFAYDIWGDTVNLASRMESSGEAGKINISGSTYELIKNDFTCTYRGKIQAKNKGEVDMYFVNEL